MQSDPLGVAGGVNLYAYTDNPARAVDLNGLAPPPKCADKTVPTKQEDGSDKEIAARRPLWSATKKLRSVENALGHFQKHGEEFHGIQNAKQYVEVATQFVRFPPPGTLTKVRSNGDVILYHPESSTFGMRDGNGIPRTMYKPDPTKHGFPTNMDYFNEQ